MNKFDKELLVAALEGNLDGVKVALQQGADINAQDKDNNLFNNGNTAIAYAAWFRRKEIVEFLIQSKADLNVIGHEGRTPLIHAISQSFEYIAKILIKAGADVNIKEKDGRTALIWAISMGKIELIEMLVEHGADVNIQLSRGRTPITLAYIEAKAALTSLIKAKCRKDIVLEKDTDYQWLKSAGENELIQFFEQAQLDALAGKRSDSDLNII